MQVQRTSRRQSIARVCEHCGDAFTVKLSAVERGHGRFCGRPCSYAAQQAVADCPVCGRQFNPRGRRYCSFDCYIVSKRVPLAERFWAKVDRSNPDGCWPWTGSRSRDGYGRVRVNGRLEQAHRVAWTLVNGPIPDALDMRHVVCDNPPCCRAEPGGAGHLAPGTTQQNVDDAKIQGHLKPPPIRHGAAHHMTKLTATQEQEIRDRSLRLHQTQTVLAAEFRVSQGTISRVLRRTSPSPQAQAAPSSPSVPHTKPTPFCFPLEL